MNAGAASKRLGVAGIPTSAESARVRRDLAIALGCRRRGPYRAYLHRGGAGTGARGRHDGLAVTCEATPHHFTLDDRAVLEFGVDAQMAPPLRAARDRAAIRAGMADGTIDMIATDHAPHDPVSKRMDRLGPLFHAGKPADACRRPTPACGAGSQRYCRSGDGARTRARAGSQGVITAARMVEMMSVNPARLLRLDGRHARSGRARRYHADRSESRMDGRSREFYSKSRNMPFAGMKLKGKALVTIVAGEIVHDARSGTEPR